MAVDRNADFFDTEMEKLDTWTEDVKSSMEIELKVRWKVMYGYNPKS
jgi:hypothetical protein